MPSGQKKHEHINMGEDRFDKNPTRSKISGYPNIHADIPSRGLSYAQLPEG